MRSGAEARDLDVGSERDSTLRQSTAVAEFVSTANVNADPQVSAETKLESLPDPWC
jgi:hypothetical protein